MLRQSDMQQCYHCCCHRHRHRRFPFYEFHFMRPHYRVYVVVVVLVVVLLVLVLLLPHAMARATAAAPPRFEGMEFRNPRNGTAYTRDEFLDYYGIWGVRMWNAAAHNADGAPPPTGHVDFTISSAPQPAGTVPTATNTASPKLPPAPLRRQPALQPANANSAQPAPQTPPPTPPCATMALRRVAPCESDVVHIVCPTMRAWSHAPGHMDSRLLRREEIDLTDALGFGAEHIVLEVVTGEAANATFLAVRIHIGEPLQHAWLNVARRDRSGKVHWFCEVRSTLPEGRQ